MEQNRNVNRNDETRQDDDQLRSNTMNETIREARGNPDADLSEISNRGLSSSGSGALRDEHLQGSDMAQGTSYSPNDLSGVRSGGTVDMDDQTAGGAGLGTGEHRSAHVTTKQGVTGSDFDGQNATS